MFKNDLTQHVLSKYKSDYDLKQEIRNRKAKHGHVAFINYNGHTCGHACAGDCRCHQINREQHAEERAIRKMRDMSSLRNAKPGGLLEVISLRVTVRDSDKKLIWRDAKPCADCIKTIDHVIKHTRLSPKRVTIIWSVDDQENTFKCDDLQNMLDTEYRCKAWHHLHNHSRYATK